MFMMSVHLSYSSLAPEIRPQPIFKAQGSEENNSVTSFDQLEPEEESLFSCGQSALTLVGIG